MSSDTKPAATKAEAMSQEPKKEAAEVYKEATPVAAAATAAPAASGADVSDVPDWVSRGQYGGILTMNVPGPEALGCPPGLLQSGRLLGICDI
jgi:hypothetical protein